MDVLSGDAPRVTVQLDGDEFCIVNNSLNEVAHGTRIPNSEFVDRLGESRSRTSHLLDAIRDEVAADSLPPDAPGPMTIRLGMSDLKLLRNAMIEVTKGDEIPEWEYPIRLGATVAEGKQLLAEVEGLIEELSA